MSQSMNRLAALLLVITAVNAGPVQAQGLVPYQDRTPESIELPPRSDSSGYVRPPYAEQTFVPNLYP